MYPDVVIIPTQGFCNRLRAIASGIVLAKHWNTKCYVRWEQESCCKCEWDDVFATRFPTIDINEVSKRKHFFSPQVHTNKVLASVSLEGYEYLVIIGGHEFKHPLVSTVAFIREKHAVYRSLEFSEKVLRRMAPLTDRFAAGGPVVGVHFRDYVPKYDQQDNYNFAEESPLDAFVDIARRVVNHEEGALAGARLFVSSNTRRAFEALARVIPKDRLLEMDSVDLERNSSYGIVDAVCSLLLLSKCGFIVGTANSSFSDEACFFNKISKLCVGTRPVTSYHCHGFHEILGHKMLLPDFNILFDIYKEGGVAQDEKMLDEQERKSAV